MNSLSLYGLLEHFNIQIRELKSHPKILKVYMKYDVIFIKGSRSPSYLTIAVRWTPNLSIFKFEFKPPLDKFLFEMQNVTAACSTILFNNLIPIKNSYFNDYQGLSDVSKGNVQVEARHAHLFFLQSNRPIKQNYCATCFLNL